MEVAVAVLVAGSAIALPSILTRAGTKPATPAAPPPVTAKTPALTASTSRSSTRRCDPAWRAAPVIENRPEDRNYVVFLVVEETFGSIEPDEEPPKVLHTAFPMQVNGQLMYVPQSLFDEEAEASQKQRAFAEQFAKSVDPSLVNQSLGKSP